MDAQISFYVIFEFCWEYVRSSILTFFRFAHIYLNYRNSGSFLKEFKLPDNNIYIIQLLVKKVL